MADLAGRHIVLAVTGGIAAYKAAQLASLLVQASARVETILTDAAQQFIAPLTFSAITHAPVHTSTFAPWADDFSGHVTLAERTDLIVVAPATAATIARLALGIADDLLGLVALSSSAPLLVAPAMEHRMFHHSATQDHLATLRQRGAVIVGPESGRLASGAAGDGRLAAPEAIVAAAARLLAPSRPLAGNRVVVTAGGTREPIDPVRYIGNRSSGQMGYAIAAAAAEAGADVVLISGPTALAPPPCVEFMPVETAAQMQAAVERATQTADVLIMAAAVADYRPKHVATGKIKKDGQSAALDLRLVPNPDILAGISRPGLLKIGFAAETSDLLANARAKLAAKGLALIVANDATATIGAPDSAATLIFADGQIRELPRMAKGALARELVQVVGGLLDVGARRS